MEFSHDCRAAHTKFGNNRNKHMEFRTTPAHFENQPAWHKQRRTGLESEIVTMKMRNFRTVGGHFSCMKKQQNTSFSRENSELNLEVLE